MVWVFYFSIFFVLSLFFSPSIAVRGMSYCGFAFLAEYPRQRNRRFAVELGRRVGQVRFDKRAEFLELGSKRFVRLHLHPGSKRVL